MGYPIRIGSVSTGTLRTVDLLKAFADALENVATAEAPHPGACDPELMDKVQEARAMAETLEEETGDDEDAAELMLEIQEMLNDRAPAFCYFGAHPGDGADFGFWPSWDFIQEEIRTGDLATGAEMPDDAEHGSFFLHVSDHGNAELYQRWHGRWDSVWSVV